MGWQVCWPGNDGTPTGPVISDHLTRDEAAQELARLERAWSVQLTLRELTFDMVSGN